MVFFMSIIILMLLEVILSVNNYKIPIIFKIYSFGKINSMSFIKKKKN